MECVQRWCSTLHNACSAVEECRGSMSVCRSVQRQRGVRDCLYNFQQRFPAAGPTPYSTAPSSLDLAAAALPLHCAVAHFPTLLYVLRLVVHLACLAGRGQQGGIRSATLNVWIKSSPKTQQGKLQDKRCRLLASSSIKPPRGLPQNSACCAEYIITVHRAASSAAKPPVLKSIKYRVVRIQCVFSGGRRAGSRVGQGAVPSPELAPPALRTALHSPPPHLPLLQYTPIHSNTPPVPIGFIPIHQPKILKSAF